jgi:hypothetical protein
VCCQVEVCCVCCVLSGRGLHVGRLTRPDDFTDCGVSEYDREAWAIERPWTNWGC